MRQLVDEERPADGFSAQFLQAGEPACEGFILRCRQNAAGEIRRQLPLPHGVPGVQNFADVQGAPMPEGRRIGRSQPQRGAVQRAREQPRPKLHRSGQVRPVRPIGGEIPGGGIVQHCRLAGCGRADGHQGPVPVNLVHADLHGRKEEAIPEMPARPQRRGGPLEVGAAGVRAIQEQAVVRSPDLAVAGHGLAVKPHVFGRCAEEHMRQPVLRAADREFARVPMDTGPAVRASVGVAHGAVPVVGPGLARVRFVHPARLGNADAAQLLGALEERQERYLKCTGKLALERK